MIKSNLKGPAKRVAGMFAHPGDPDPPQPHTEGMSMNDIISSQRRLHTPIRSRGTIRARLSLLSPDQVEAGMSWLAGYDPAIFDAVIDAAQSWNDGLASPRLTALPPSL